ncbi:unnamed protein product [Cuscuta campestris]|uniref:CCHC-type domain-containing protein n=1 Tax=Cuscuta campestris TaxID=132261 RepID=A0A484M4W9_9ASTE|nr:unnamed protein product [Cuscuta campestris]
MGSSSRNLYAGIGEGQSTSRPPLFDGINYTYWKGRMRIYIRSTNFQLWLVIKNDEETPMKKVDEKLVPKNEDKFDAKDIKKVENYAKAINMLYCAVNPDDYRKISCCTIAKEKWDKLEVTYEGEKIDDMFDRFSKIINDLHALKKTYANKDLVRKILWSLTPEWRSKADAIYESIGVSNVTIDGLRDSLERIHFEDDEENTGIYTNTQPQIGETPQETNQGEEENQEEEEEQEEHEEEATELPIAWRTNKNHPLDQNGDSLPIKKIGDALIPKDEDEYDEADLKKAQLNATAINFLYCGVNANDYQKISRCQTNNQMWNKLMITYEGTPQVRESKIDLLTHEYELFAMKENKLVEDMFGRFSNIVNDLDMLGKTLTDKELVRKILRSLTKEWESKVNSIYEGRDYNVITYDGLRGNLITYETNRLSHTLDVKKRTGISFKASSSHKVEIGDSDSDSDSDSSTSYDILVECFNEFLKHEQNKSKKKITPKCHKCGKLGHQKFECPKLKKIRKQDEFAYFSWKYDEPSKDDCLIALEEQDGWSDTSVLGLTLVKVSEALYHRMHFHVRMEPLELCGNTGHNDTLYISRVVLILLEGSEFGRTSISIRGLGRIRFEDVEFPLTVKNDSEVHLPVKKVGPG